MIIIHVAEDIKRLLITNIIHHCHAKSYKEEEGEEGED